MLGAVGSHSPTGLDKEVASVYWASLPPSGSATISSPEEKDRHAKALDRAREVASRFSAPGPKRWEYEGSDNATGKPT